MANNLKAERTLTAEELQQVISECDELTDATDFWGHNPSFIKAMASMALQPLSTQQPMGEPVAWMHPTAGWARTKYHSVLVHCRKDGPKPIPLYALHPNQESGE